MQSPNFIIVKELKVDYKDLLPEEKLYHAIFGEPSRERVKHFLPPEGCQALHDVLKKFEDNHGGRGRRGVYVLRLRFCLEPLTAAEEKLRNPRAVCRSLKEVGSYFGLTPERIRQIQNWTLRLLRHPAYSRELKRFLP